MKSRLPAFLISAFALAPLCAPAQDAPVPAQPVPAASSQDAPVPAQAVPAESASSSGGKKIVIELPELPTSEDVRLKFTGLVQAQYVYATASGGGAGDRDGFSLRRTILGVSAELGDDWSAKLTYEFDSTQEGGSADNGYVDTATISRKFGSAGTLSVGHKKAHFMLEEYSPSSQFPCLERSINSNFVTNNVYARGLSGSHIGVYWEGKIPRGGDYGFSLTNAVAKDYDRRSNDLAITGYFGGTLKLSDGAQLYFGLNGTVNFGDDGVPPGVDGSSSSALTNAGTVYGVEPYVRFTSGGLMLLADVFFIDGSSSSRLDPFYGVNLTGTFRFGNGFEPALRFTYLNTESGLVNANVQNRVPSSGGFNNAATYYAGVNYYFTKDVKLAVGYEYGHYFGGGSVSSADSGAFRTMLQVSF